MYLAGSLPALVQTDSPILRGAFLMSSRAMVSPPLFLTKAARLPIIRSLALVAWTMASALSLAISACMISRFVSLIFISILFPVCCVCRHVPCQFQGLLFGFNDIRRLFFFDLPQNLGKER